MMREAETAFEALMTKLSGFRWMLGLVLLAVSGCVALGVYAAVVQMRAAAILKEVYALKVGTSTLGDVERLAPNLSRPMSQKECTSGTCAFWSYVNNSWLSSVGIEPWAVFGAEVTVEKGTVRRIRVSLMRDTRVFPTSPSAGFVTECVTYGEGREWKPYDFPQPVGKPYLDVKLNRDATPQQRQRAYAFSLKCLTKPGAGCDLPCDYLPLAWKDWKAQWENEPYLRRAYPGRARCE